MATEIVKAFDPKGMKGITRFTLRNTDRVGRFFHRFFQRQHCKVEILVDAMEGRR